MSLWAEFTKEKQSDSLASMDLFSLYIKERLGHKSIIEAWGFITYSIVEKVCRIEDLFIRSEVRGQGKATELADRVTRIAREADCTLLWAQVWTNTNDTTLSLQACLGYGFKVVETDPKRIILLKSLGG